MKKIILVISILLVTVSVSFAKPVDVGQARGETVSASKSKTVQTMDLYDPEPSGAEWFNEHNLVVYSRTSKNGEQTDIVRKGNFFKELFIGNDGLLHVKRCGNKVFQIAVEKEYVSTAGAAGKDGKDGNDGNDGKRGPRGPQGEKGDQGIPGTGVTNYYFSSAPVMGYQIGGQSPYMNNSMQLLSVSLIPVSNTNIKVSANATGGSVGDIINNNSNANTNVNNNVIAIDGTATGTGDGTSSAGSGNQQ